METGREIVKRLVEQTKSRLDKTNTVIITTRNQYTIFDREIAIMRETLKQQQKDLEER